MPTNRILRYLVGYYRFASFCLEGLRPITFRRQCLSRDLRIFGRIDNSGAASFAKRRKSVNLTAKLESMIGANTDDCQSVYDKPPMAAPRADINRSGLVCQLDQFFETLRKFRSLH